MPSQPAPVAQRDETNQKLLPSFTMESHSPVNSKEEKEEEAQDGLWNVHMDSTSQRTQFTIEENHFFSKYSFCEISKQCTTAMMAASWK